MYHLHHILVRIQEVIPKRDSKLLSTHLFQFEKIIKLICNHFNIYQIYRSMPCWFKLKLYVSSYLVLIRVSIVYLNGMDDKQYNEQRGYRKVTKLKQKSNLKSIYSVVKCFLMVI